MSTTSPASKTRKTIRRTVKAVRRSTKKAIKKTSRAVRLADLYTQFLISYLCAIIPSAATITAAFIVALTNETARPYIAPLIIRFGPVPVALAETIATVLVVWNRVRANETAAQLVAETRKTLTKKSKRNKKRG